MLQAILGLPAAAGPEIEKETQRNENQYDCYVYEFHKIAFLRVRVSTNFGKTLLLGDSKN